MPSIQIDNVPEQVLSALRQQAVAAGQSLQTYVRALLIREAGRPTLDAMLDPAGSRSGDSLPLSVAVAVLRSDRARH